MPREYVLMRCRAYVGRRNRQLSPSAQWLYQHLHYQPDLSMIGTLALNARKWAGHADPLTVDETDRLLECLEAADLILMDTCTQEVFLTEFMENNKEIRHANHVRGAAKSWHDIESERLRMAVYEALPESVREALTRASPGPDQGLARASEGPDQGLATTATATATADIDLSVVLRKLQQENPRPDYDNDDPDSISVKVRVDEAVIMLALRRVAEAPLSWSAEGALADQWAKHAALLMKLAWDYPDWSPGFLADAIDRGPFDG